MVRDIKNFKNILNKTPLRVSFCGGGTELPEYYSKFGGCVINATINLFIYTKIEKKENINLSNEIEITDKFFEGLKDYGVFYVYHLSKEKIDNENIISNRCYIGYSQNQNLPSFVHGNTLARFTEISGNKKVYSDIVKTSFFQNQIYKIQKYFNNFDKNELFFSNPTSKIIKFSIDDKKFKLKNGCSLIIDISDKKIITIKSNCLFLRPTVFSYKDEYLDVHHS